MLFEWSSELTSSVFREYVDTGVSVPLRQGDVIERISVSGGSFDQYLLVITADCDLENSKHRNQVTCVSLMQARKYLHELTVDSLADELKSKALNGVREALSRTKYNRISDERIVEWVEEVSCETIAEQLEVVEPVKQQRLVAYLSAIRLLGQNHDSLEKSMHALGDISEMLPSGKSKESYLVALNSRVVNAFRSPPGDAFFLNSIGPGLNNGFFAYLRHIVQIEESLISLGPSRRSDTYRRISTLEDRYTHAVVQRFALVFMSIGMPHDYEESRNALSGRFG